MIKFKYILVLLVATCVGTSTNLSSVNATEFAVRLDQNFSPLTLRPSIVSLDKMDTHAMRDSSSQQGPNVANIIYSFIDEGVEHNPLPLKSVVQEELLDSGLMLNIDKIITQAFDNNFTSMALLGGLYLRCEDVEKAQSFLFPSAKAQNADAFWLLSSMYRNKYFTSKISNLDMMLLNEAERLGSMDAKIYKNESEL